MKSKRTAYLLWFFLGWLGIHRFYCRQWILGAIWLIAFGLLGVGSRLDPIGTAFLGVFWGMDAIRIGKLVDEANDPQKKEGTPLHAFGLWFERCFAPKTEVKLLRKFGLLTFAILGCLAFYETSSWISEKLDKRTPEQKATDAVEVRHSYFRSLKRNFPSLDAEGKVVPIKIAWSDSQLIIENPKTFGFGAPRFRQQFTTVQKDYLKRNLEEFDGNYFANVYFEIWTGPSPGGAYYMISIPKAGIPSDLLKNAASQP